MPRPSSGTVDEFRPGQWRVRVSIGGKQRLLEVCHSESEARLKLDVALECAREHDSEKATTDSSFGACAIRWMKAREAAGHVTEPHEEVYRFNAYIRDDSIAAVPIHLVSRTHVIEWVDRVRVRVKANTVKNALQIVRGTLGRAYDTGRIKSNPAVGVKVRRDASPSERVHLSLDEQTALIAAAGPRWVDIAFAMGTGLRAGEQCALRMRDVIASECRIVVSRGHPDGRTTKTKKTREVFAMGPAVAALEHQVSCRMQAGAGPDEPLFPSVSGGFRPQNLVMRGSTFKAILASAGLSSELRWHDLRHALGESLAGGYWGEQVDLHTVATQMGHSRITMTEKYSHLSVSTLRRAAEKVNRAHQIQSAAAPNPQPQLGTELGTACTLNLVSPVKKLEVRMGLEPTYAGFARRILFQNSDDTTTGFSAVPNSVPKSNPTMATAFIEALVTIVETAAVKDTEGCAKAMLATRMATIAAMSGGLDEAVQHASELLAFMASAVATEAKEESA